MKYVNVKMNDDSNVIISIYKEKYSIGTPVIVQSKEEVDYGVITSIYEEKSNIKKDDTYVFIRFANSNDRRIYKKNNIESQKAFIKCRELIKKYKLPMKLIEAKYTFTKDQLIFSFYSDERVDFRKLAKELAKIYHTRIELRQVGVRDKAKRIGGCGQCGYELCCKGFLKKFNSVSINMAKNQNIALNPNKINGICGRLLCCLQYEDECYKECRKKIPKVGSMVEIKNGKGKVLSVNPLAGKYKVVNDKDEIIECEANGSFE